MCHVSSIQPRSAAPTGASLQTLFMLVLVDSEQDSVHDTVHDALKPLMIVHREKKSPCSQVIDVIAVASPLALASVPSICSQRKRKQILVPRV